ncbi:MAG TPA: rhomboid family intramembrane serine protease [Candidatus Obscuribacterales bacterium]
MHLNEQPGPYRREFADIPDQQASEAALRDVNIPKTPATKLIVGINVAVFIAVGIATFGQRHDLNGFAMNPSDNVLSQWGIDYGPYTLNSEQYWRLLASTFLHANIMHIGFNMYAFWDAGRASERLYGSGKFIFIYLFAGIAASLTSMFFNPQIASLGASGAIFGVFGAFLVFLRWHAASFDKAVVASVTRSIVMLVIINLIWGFSMPHIDNAAHIGGFVFGTIAGVVCVPRDARSHAWSWRNALSALALLGMLYFGLQLDIAHFQTQVP